MPSTGRSCRTFKQARIDLGREFGGWNLPVRPANTPVSVHHHVSPCFISLHLCCNHLVICSFTVTEKNPTFLILPARTSSDKSSSSVSLTIPVNLHLDASSVEPLLDSIALLILALHSRRRSSYRTSYRNPVAVDPSGRHTLETGKAGNDKGNMQRAHLERENIVGSRSQEKPVHAASTNEGMGSKTCACSINE